MVANNIQGYVRISGNRVIKNGTPVLNIPDLPFDEFSKTVFKTLDLTYPAFYKMDKLCRLGFLASEMLLMELRQHMNYKPEEYGMVFSNRSSSLDTDFEYFQTIKDRGNYFPSPAVFVYTLPNIVIGEISIRNKFQGENAFFISEDFDADFMAEYVNSLLNEGKLQGCLCGWLEILNDKYDAFVYMATAENKNSRNKAILHTAEEVKKLYSQKEITWIN